VISLFTSGMDYLEIFDADHSDEEERFICIGRIARDIVLVVVVDVNTDLIRLLSVRHPRAVRENVPSAASSDPDRFRKYYCRAPNS
jgi:uncharacterized DUF497 family protein